MCGRLDCVLCCPESLPNHPAWLMSEQFAQLCRQSAPLSRCLDSLSCCLDYNLADYMFCWLIRPSAWVLRHLLKHLDCLFGCLYSQSGCPDSPFGCLDNYSGF